MISKGSRFRFPVVAIALMVFTFAGIVFAIHNARVIALSMAGTNYLHQVSFLQTFGFAFGVTLAAAVLVWAVLHTLHRSGVHRLSQAQTWPGK